MVAVCPNCTMQAHLRRGTVRGGACVFHCPKKVAINADKGLSGKRVKRFGKFLMGDVAGMTQAMHTRDDVYRQQTILATCCQAIQYQTKYIHKKPNKNGRIAPKLFAHDFIFCVYCKRNRLQNLVHLPALKML